MPYSDSSFDALVGKRLRQWAYRYYLDIGPGAGKYGKLIRQIVPDAYVEALEAESSYVRDFNLGEIYDHVVVGPATEIADSNPDYHTECVILGDSIEHMRKSEGIDLLHYLLYRSKRILVIFPERYIQYSWKGHASEAHRSSWGREDFKALRHRWYVKGYMRLAVVEGYLGQSNDVDPDTEELLKAHRPMRGR